MMHQAFLRRIFRAKDAAEASPPVSRSPSVEALNQALCLNQFESWLGRRIDACEAANEYRTYNETRLTTFLFRVKDGEIILEPKPPNIDGHVSVPRVLQDRANTYLGFFRDVLNHFGSVRDCLLAVEVGDGPLNSASAPILSFQKFIGDNTILLNDINFIEGDFYESTIFSDEIEHDQKLNKAIFAGATSGGHNDVANVRARINPRIRAGLFFKDSDLVEFRLPNIVQCDPAGEQLLRELGFGSGGMTSWQEQFGYKFLISMDGNGATCQRLAVALRSNSVVLKYASQSQLYYFSGMIPWYHYIPINSDADVLAVVAKHAENAELYATINRNGRAFADTYLSRTAVEHYAHVLLTRYSELFDPKM